MRNLLILLCFIPFGVQAQSALDVCIDSIYSAYIHNLPSPTPSQIASTLALATKQCNAIFGAIGSAGGGTMTSLTPGIGFTSHTPITTAGTINIDTAGLIGSKAWANNTFYPLTNPSGYISSYTETDPLSFHKADSNTSANAVTLTYYNAHLPAATDTSHLSARINLKVNFTDTAAMLAPYYHASNPAGYISGYTETDPLSFHKSDSNTHGNSVTLDYFNNNIPDLTGYVPYTGAAHNLVLGSHVLTTDNGSYNSIVSPVQFGSYNAANTKYSVITIDGLTVNNISPATTMTVTDSGLVFPNGGVQTYKADSGTYVTPYYYTSHLPSLTGYVPTTRTLTVNGTAYDLSANRSWSVGTLVGSDTASLSTRINARVKYTDTAAMLSPYLRTAVTSLATDATLTTTAATGAITVGLNLANANTWTALQTLNANGLGASTSNLLRFTNTTASTTINPYQVSPSMRFLAHYNTAGTDHTSEFQIMNEPYASAGAGALSFGSSVDGGAFTRYAIMNSSGGWNIASLAVANSLVVTGGINANNGITVAVNKKITYTTGTNGCSGTATLVAGTVTVSTTCTPTAGQILLTGENGGTPCSTCGTLSQGTLTAGTSFVIWSSNNSDTRVVHWTIISN